MKKIVLFLTLLSLAWSSFATTHFEKPFVFGVANAPGQVEDQLEDIWVDYGLAGKIAAWSNHAVPEERLRFWTDPETEITI